MKLKAQKAIIYVRVSDDKQRDNGSGLDSQAHRCRKYASSLDLPVEAQFTDDITGEGDGTKRPGMSALIRHVKKNKGTQYVVIFDDLKRFARDTRGHWDLRDLLKGKTSRSRVRISRSAIPPKTNSSKQLSPRKVSSNANKTAVRSFKK